jgi:hypothetical protein
MVVERVAYVDESYREHEGGGFYVLAAAVLDDEVDRSRTAMLALRGARQVGKVHWNEMDSRDRQQAVTVVAELSGVHVVAVGSPVPRRGQERARAVTLRRLVFELHARGVRRMLIEARQVRLDRRDVQVVIAARYDLPRGVKRPEVQHCAGSAEPLLWIADIVAGAVRADRQGESGYIDLLGSRVEVIAVDC